MNTDNLILDRTEADVSRLKSLKAAVRSGTATASEIAEYLNNPKGAYNASDLNRVGTALIAIKTELEECGYSISYPSVPKTDWTNEFPTAAQMVNYIGCIQAVRNALPFYPSTTPAAPTTMNSLDVYKANDIEQIIKDCSDLLIRIRVTERYCGTTYAE